MKKLFLIFGVVAVVLCSCNKTNSLEGTYVYDKEASSDLESFVESSPMGSILALAVVLSSISKDDSLKFSNHALTIVNDSILNNDTSVNNNVKDILPFEKIILKDSTFLSSIQGNIDSCRYNIVTENNSTQIILKDENSKPLDTILYNNEKQTLDWHGLIFKRKQ